MATFWKLLLVLDGAIYNLIDYVYDIFDFLAKLNLFENEDYQAIVGRIYIVLGMIMLFVLAYSLLRAVVNPDDFAKGEQSFPKLIQNIIVSLIIIAVLPTVFTVAFNIQNAILNNNSIPKLILGVDDYESTMKSDAGKQMGFYVFQAFFHPSEEYCIDKGIDVSTSDGLDACADTIGNNGALFVRGNTSLKDVNTSLLNGKVSFLAYTGFSEAVRDDDVTYMWLVSTIAGAFLLYVLLNFCFDMAVRVVKLMFFQIIAPIPVVCRVIPFGGLKDVFSKWTKNTVSTFVEVFIRVAVMYLGVFMVLLVIKRFDGVTAGYGLGISQRFIAKALIIMGVVIFIKQAPKLIGDMFGLDSGSMKLGLMDKLAMGGALTAGATVGGLATSGARNLISGIKSTGKKVEAAKAKGKSGLAAGIRGGLWTGLSAAAGGLSGGARGLYGGKGAKNLGDMKNAASKAAADAGKAKAKRDAYRAAHKADVPGLPDDIETLLGVGLGHAGDFKDSVASWAGINNLQDLMDENKVISDITSSKKAMSQAAEDLIIGEANKNKSRNFGITGVSSSGQAFNTAILRSMRQAMETAKANGAANAGSLEDAYDLYKKEFVDAVQNQALLGKKLFNGLADDDRADLGVVQDAADKYRGILKDNINKDYVQAAGFTLTDFDPETSLDVGNGGLKQIGTKLKLAQNENNRKINELRKKEEQKQQNGK